MPAPPRRTLPTVGEDLAKVQHRFANFAQGHAHLPLYHRISAAAARDDEVAALLLAARPGQARPVLLLAALHDLVLRRPDLPAARWYASVVGRETLPTGDPWPEVRTTVLDHRDELTDVIATRTTQTNEVNRTVYLTAGLTRAAAGLPDTPLALVELGASAGLLLALDRYDTALTRDDAPSTRYGDPASPVRCGGEDRSPTPLGLAIPPIASRAGLDLDPVDLHDAKAVRWLEACLWPDVAGRVERFTAAVDLVRSAPPPVVRGDLVDDLADVVGQYADDPATHLVVYTSWSLTYVDKARRPAVAQTLARLAASGRPVSWLTAEPAGCVPGIPALQAGLDDDSTVLGLRTWRHGDERTPAVLGTAHPHGERVCLTPWNRPSTDGVQEP